MKWYFQSGLWPLACSHSPRATNTSIKGPLGGPHLDTVCLIL